jgi:hypothetical protein
MNQVRKYRVFLSAVSSEFGQARGELATYLIAHGHEPVWQLAFPDHGNAETLQGALFDLVACCGAIICLHGQRSGSYPPSGVAHALAAHPPSGEAVKLPEELSEASRTQWECFFAKSLGKPTRSFRPCKEFQPDQATQPVLADPQFRSRL